MLLISGSPSRAAYQFGEEDKITKIVDLNIRGPAGETLYLGYKVRITSVFLPVYMTDDGYVIGISDDNTRYFSLTADKIAALQRQGQLPDPLPPYEIGWAQWLFGYFLWVCLLAFALIAACVGIVKLVSRRRIPEVATDIPLTVAGMVTRRNRRILALVLIGLIPIVALVWSTQKVWLTVMLGPRPASGAQIAAAQSAGDQHLWFVLTEQPLYLNVNRVSVYRNQQGAVHKDTYYLHILPGSPSILFEAARPNPDAPIYAWISSSNPFDGHYRPAREAAERSGYANIAPYMLSWNAIGPAGIRIMTGLLSTPVVAVLLLLLYRLTIAIRGLREPLRSPEVGRLLKSSRASEGIDHLVQEIESQAAGARLSLNSYGTFLLPSWLIIKWKIFRLFRIVSTEDIIWIAPRWNRYVRSYGVDIVDRFGRRLFYPSQNLEADLRRVASRAPWVAFGADPQMERAFGKGKSKPFGWLTQRHLRAALVQQVDERRLDMLAQMNAAQVR
jgi:hypothetical protein